MSTPSRRTLVYAPADRPEKVDRAAASDGDGIIFDLESTVEEANKDRARANLSAFLSEVDLEDKETVVRINDLRSARWLADVEAAIEAGADTLRLPKVETPEEIERAVAVAQQVAGSASPPEVLIQLETPEGVLNGSEIASTCAQLPSVTGIGVGMGDYTTALGVDDHTPELRAFLLNQIAAFAAVGGMDALGYVHKDLEDLREVATMARDLGHVGQPVSSKVEPDAFVDVLHDVYPETITRSG